jgi:hypothetical protein
MGEASQHSTATTGRDKKKKKPAELASVSETLAFVFDCGTKNVILFCVGAFGGIGNGAVRGDDIISFSIAFDVVQSFEMPLSHTLRCPSSQ